MLTAVSPASHAAERGPSLLLNSPVLKLLHCSDVRRTVAAKSGRLLLHASAQATCEDMAKMGATQLSRSLTRGALDRKLAADEVGQLAVGLHAARQRRHALAQRLVRLCVCVFACVCVV